ncbi:FAD-dependent oxidoreductase [Sphingobacterium sp.]|uniref:FAD-dependent oxidoreductase n=1 Tax=Sphingobacterium sp. TaxID=341027 RepID=UPI00289908C8|nr:FAD-dependent oxidoreductase [Sphingobacterium sp.]
MRFRFLLLIFLVLPLLTFAQKKAKPKMLIYADGFVGWAAAVQASKSNVETILVIDNLDFLASNSGEKVVIDQKYHLNGGIWMELLMDMAMSKTKDQVLANTVKTDFSPRLASNSIERFKAKMQGVTIIVGQEISKCERGRRNWQLILSNKDRFNVPVVIDATKDGKLYRNLGMPDSLSARESQFLPLSQLTLPLSRTTMAVEERAGAVYVATLQQLLNAQYENMFSIGPGKDLTDSPNDIPMSIALGQGLAAIAGYCAFFDTSVDKLDVRKVQSELLTFNARLNPYVDVAIDDPHYGSIQKFYLTGFFLGEVKDGAMYFHKDTAVRFDDVKGVLNDIYSRGQLWFLDNYRNEEMKWKDLLSLIKFVSLKGDEVEQQLIKEWSTKRKFEGSYDPEAFVTRGQLAVVTDLYSASYAKAIHVDGQFKK